MSALSSLRGSAAGLIIATVLALATGVFVFLAVRDDDDEPATLPTQAQMVEVLRASENIPARTEITSSMIELVEVPQEAVLLGALASADTVVGRTSRVPIIQGEQFVPAKLIDAPALRTEGLTFVVPQGLRAMAISADRVIGAGGLVRPGDRVDIVALIDVTYDLRNLGDETQAGRDTLTETRSFLVGQNVEVLAVEQELQQRLGQETVVEDGTLLEQPEIQPDATVVTLALTPEQTRAVLMADERGVIRLAVRGEGDNTIVEMDDLTVLALFHPDLAEVLWQAFLAQIGDLSGE